MIRKGPRRRLRIRRKRKGKSVASEVGGAARDAAGEAAAQGTVEVVGEFGGCVVEAVGSAALLVAVLTVPAYLLIR